MFNMSTIPAGLLSYLTGCITLEVKEIEDQYDKIDAIKLDKVVYETTMQQFTSMQTDLLRGNEV